MHLMLSVLWLASSSAWASSLSSLKWATSFETLQAENPHICTDKHACHTYYEPAYGKLDISIVSRTTMATIYYCQQFICIVLIE